jgi:hypothetical protein
MRINRGIRLLTIGIGAAVLVVGAPAGHASSATRLAPAAQGAPTMPTAPTGGVHGQEVRAVRQNGDGTTTYTIWTAADGVTSAQLFAKLQAKGERGLINPAAIVPNDPPDCDINGAYALYRRCGINRLHWAGSHPKIYFTDYTGSAWPVLAAASVWNQATALDALYHWQSCPGANCAYVSDYNYGDTGWVGSTHVTTTGVIINVAGISLNDHRGPGYMPAGDTHWHRETACHEEGHALGLDHNLFLSSCLYSLHSPGRSTTPSSADYQMLLSIY